MRGTPRRHDAGQAPRAGDREGGLRHAAEERARPQKLRLKLRVYADAKHPHGAQQPTPLTFEGAHRARRTSPRRPSAAARRRLPRVPHAGFGQVEPQRPHARGLLPAPALVSAIQQPFTATDTLGSYDVKANLDGGGVDRPGRRAPPRDRPRAGEDRRDAPPQAPRPRPAHARCPRGRAQEAGPSEGAASGSSSASGKYG